MVPSDLSNNSASFRHARLKLCNPGDCAPWSLCSPLRNFFRLGSMLRAAPVYSLQIGTRASERAFRSLETTARYRATIPRSKLLAYPFSSTLSSHRTRSITPLLHAIQVSP